MTKVLVSFIQDRSGSMSSVWDETVSGFKEFVKGLKEGKDKVDYLFSLTTFDTLIETPFIAKAIADIPLDALKPHGPRGSTALYDAVGATLKATETAPIITGVDKYIVVIVTDGQENSSREWTKDALQKAVEERIARGNWTFTYKGTQPETWADAQAFGIAAGAAATYTPTMARSAYRVTGLAVQSLAASSVAGSASLMDDFVTDKMAANAGMRKAPVNSNPIPPPKAKEKAAAKGGRWR